MKRFWSLYLLIIACNAFSQNLIGKSLQELKPQYPILHTFYKNGESLHRTIIIDQQNKKTIYAYTNNKNIVTIQLKDNQTFDEVTFDNIDTNLKNSNSDFQNGLAVYRDKNNGLAGFINEKGEVIIEAEYTFLGKMSEGLAYFAIVQYGENQINNSVGYLNMINQHVIKLSPTLAIYFKGMYFHGSEFKHGRAEMTTTEYGAKTPLKASIIIDTKGNLIQTKGFHIETSTTTNTIKH